MEAKRIFLIGAGRSSTVLIDYLLSRSEEMNWTLTVGDSKQELAKSKVGNHPNAKAIWFDMFDNDLLENQVAQADLVISMLPANLHHYVAKVCIANKTHLLTASYVSDEIRALEGDAIKNDVLVLMETGLDPGIDHMSAMAEIDKIHEGGGEIISFKSFTGGLVAPESDNNPWNYKITWNPRNVVLAGQGVVKFIRNGLYKYIPYNSVFTRLEKVNVQGYGEFEAYANRDSLKYREIYGLDAIPTIFRGTLRRPGFSAAWNALVRLGMTDDTFVVEGSEHMTYRDFTNSFLVYHPEESVETKLARYLKVDEHAEVMKKIAWLGLFEDQRINVKSGTPAQILQSILEQKWQLDDHDRDMIVMQHQFEYQQQGEKKKISTSMVVLGDDREKTSMAKTVGVPLGIAAKLILTNQIQLTGVQIPTDKQLYTPILKELEEEFSVRFFRD